MRGFQVAVVDPSEDPPARRDADIFLQLDVRDHEQIFQRVSGLGINAVVSNENDISIPSVAFIAAKLGLPGMDIGVAEAFTNKALMRQRVAAVLGLGQPKFYVLASRDHLSEVCTEFTYPVVVKPSSSQGSRGVRLVNSDKELEPAFELAQSANFRDTRVLIEELITGNEVAVESVVTGGNVRPLLISDKRHFASNPFLDQFVCFPSEIEQQASGKLLRLNEDVIKALGLSDGITHAEFRIQIDGTPKLIEIAARGAGGGITSTIIPALTGLRVLDFLLDLALSKNPSPVFDPPSASHALLGFFDSVKGRISQVRIEAQAHQASVELEISRSMPCDYFGGRDSSDRLGRYIVLGRSMSEVYEKRKSVINHVKFILQESS
jgi:carbamoyl-phosphate synthase large subunit